jgi:hypothetical protein
MADVHTTRRVALAFAIVLVRSAYVAGGPANSEALNTNICEISDKPSEYEGKLVRIRAVYAGTFESSELLDRSCGKSVWFTTSEGNASVAAIVVYSPYPKVPEVPVELVKDKEYEKFTKLAYATVENLQAEYEVTATFTGRIDRCKDFKLSKNGIGNGFGQRGRSEFQLVLRSVSDVNATEAKGILQPTRSALPDHIPEKQ